MNYLMEHTTRPRVTDISVRGGAALPAGACPHLVEVRPGSQERGQRPLHAVELVTSKQCAVARDLIQSSPSTLPLLYEET